MSNVKRMDIWKVVRTVLEKNPGLKGGQLWRKVRGKTGLSRSTIYYHLESFGMQGKIRREKGRYWLPKSRLKGRRATLRHRRQLSLGLKAILGEDWFLYRPYEDRSEVRARWREEIEYKGIRYKELATEYLRKNYPKIYDKMQHRRKLREKAKEALLKEGKTEQEGKNIVNLVTFAEGDPKISEESEKLLEQRKVAYQDFASDIEHILLMLEQGSVRKTRA